MNDKKIAFIICVSNELYFNECNWYLEQLVIPKGFEKDVIAIREADSITEAYNAAISSTDAKYKVYLHQDVFICNINFIEDLLRIFKENIQIGLVGLIGGVNLPKNGVIYNAWNCGRTIACDWTLSIDTCFYQARPYTVVDAVDGMLLATQYDIPWRQDILKQWDFYDISQSFEFKRAGYQIVIPYQDQPWTIHDCGYSNLRQYDENRKIMLKAYPDFFDCNVDDHPLNFNDELYVLTNQLYQEIGNLINHGHIKAAIEILDSFEENRLNKNLLLLRHCVEIFKLEGSFNFSPNIFDRELSVDQLIERFAIIKFYLRRLELSTSIELEEIIEWICVNQISPMEILIITTTNLVNRPYVLELMMLCYEKLDKHAIAELFASVKKQILDGKLGTSLEDKNYIQKCKKEAEYWSNYKENTDRTRWWQSPKIIKHYNKTICGEALEGWNAGPIRLLSDRNIIPSKGFQKAISIGCGSALKEINLLKKGIVKSFTCIDISEGMIERAKENARIHQIENQIEFLCGDINMIKESKEEYDLVFWDNSLHHMEHAEEAIKISYELLKPDGVLFCNDFIGNTRFQWTDMQMAIINGIRLYLTDDYFVDMSGRKLNRYLVAPTIQQMLNVDPSEAADSQNIIPAIKKNFKNPTIIPTGGLIYHLCLEDILQNMPERSEILEHMLELDDQTIQFGLSLYAFIYAKK